MEEVSSEKNHVNITFFGETHNFMETLPAVVATDGVALIVSDMIIGGYQNANRVGVCCCLVFFPPVFLNAAR